ncbi:polysaccharide lyase family 1 protein [Pedobacter sp. SYSU D00535]|uniref:pectate lyase family protein n=1 Tax=Pedobacter sp. SYSU D00535 TaxID=2810308 RepID=UPI001A97B8B2|nr:pectate lyase [Pedobacter sp. SYSU D00535]
MRKFILFIIVFCGIVAQLQAQLPAFPGAEGWGRYSKGGRGGVVLKVTNLNDSGPGSFREAVTQAGPRIVIFEVSGTIDLTSPIEINSPYLTIAGQTAPGEGICLKRFPLKIHNTHDIIIRGIRVRPGTESGLIGSEIDALNIDNSENVIVDHCVFSWSVDEGINTWHGARMISVQWCMMSEPLNHSIHEKGAHGYSGSIGGYKSSFHHNLLANGAARNPSIAGNNQAPTVLLDFRNCVISNWGHRSCDGKPLSINLVNNYYKPGPATNEDVKRRIARIDNAEKLGFSGLWYVEGNYVEGYPEISANNRAGGIDFEEGTTPEKNLRKQAFEVAPVTTQSAREAYELVLKYAGYYPQRDSQEKRILEQIRTGKYSSSKNGLIDRVEQAGGWPELKQGKLPKDSDKDGMPDDWERKNGLNPANPSDAASIAASGYMNIESYINSLLPDIYSQI